MVLANLENTILFTELTEIEPEQASAQLRQFLCQARQGYLVEKKQNLVCNNLEIFVGFAWQA